MARKPKKVDPAPKEQDDFDITEDNKPSMVMPEDEIKEALKLPNDVSPKQPWSKRKKLLVFGIPSLVVLLLIVLAFTPLAYPAYGFMQKPQTLAIKDSDYNTDLDNLVIKLDGKTLVVKGDQPYNFNTKPGNHTLEVSKQYYKTETTKFTVKPFGSALPTIRFYLKATGRPVFVQVNHAITQKPLEKAKVTFEDSSAETDKSGKALIMVPAGKNEITVAVSKDGYKTVGHTLTVVQSASKDKIDPKNTLKLSPNGTIYFLSKRTGKINVMKSDLDGGNAKVVLAGTGQEDQTGTVLLATRDWKYLALKAIRTDQKERLYLINTSNDKLTTIDEGEATFEPTGWHDHTFVYTVIRTKDRQNERYRLKAFNAENEKITVLDRSAFQDVGAGYTADYYGPGYGAYFDQRYKDESFTSVNLAGNKVYYVVNPLHSGVNDDADYKFVSVNLDGSGKKTVLALNRKVFYGMTPYLYEPDEFYIRGYDSKDGKDHFYEFELADSTAKEITDPSKFPKTDEAYPTYLQSPSGKKTLWSESRDGKSVIFIGDKDGEDGKEIANLSEFDTYGWYTDDYILVTKKSSELYIMGVDGGEPFKATDYHKPAYQFNGYGGGYGGR